jgi:hypothetical protein
MSLCQKWSQSRKGKLMKCSKSEPTVKNKEDAKDIKLRVPIDIYSCFL